MAAQELKDAILRATKDGDTEAVARMLDEAPQLLSLEREGLGLLLEAAHYGHADLVTLLVERGAGLETSDMVGNTPLRLAAAGGHEEVVSILLRSGADTTSRGDGGWTALMCASSAPDLSMVRLFLQHTGAGALNAGDGGGRTALWFACCGGYPETARALLLAGADHTIASDAGTSLRMLAQLDGNGDIIALLDWWEPELQRAYVLHKARTLHDDTATHQHTPAAPVPPYLRTRVTAGTVIPSVEVVARHRERYGGVARGKRARQQGEETQGETVKGSDGEAEASEGMVDIASHFERVRVEEEEMGAVVGLVAKDLAPELYIELQAAFHFTEACF